KERLLALSSALHSQPKSLNGSRLHPNEDIFMERHESKTETNPFEAMVSRFNVAAEKLNLDEGLYQVMLTADREICVAIHVQLDNGKLKVFKGYRVQHSLARGPAKGGI